MQAAREAVPVSGARAAHQPSRRPLASGRTQDGRLSLAIALFCLLVIGALWVGVAAVVAHDRGETLAAAYKENDNLARAFEEHVVSTIGGLDQLVRLVILQYEQQGDRLDLRRVFDGVMASNPALHQITIIDEHGYVKLSSLPHTRVNLSDREHFYVHRDRDTGKPFISKPLLGRVSGKWSLQVTRRINTASGGFGGVAVLSLDPYYFARFYRQVDLGADGLVAVLGTDGVMRARQVGPQFSLGQSVTETAFAVRDGASSGHFLAPSPVDQVRRLVSYRVMADYPFVVLVGTAEAEVFAGFRQRRSQFVLAALAATALLALAALRVLQLARRQVRYAAELRDARARQKAFMDSVPDVGWVKDGAGRFIAVNRAFAAHFGIDQDAATGKTDEEVFGGPAAAKLRSEDRQVMQSGDRLRFETVVERADGPRWFETIKVPFYGPDGAIRGTCGVSREITERKLAEAAVRESETRLRLSLEAADVALFDWNIETGEVYISERWSAFLGGSAAPTWTRLSALRKITHPDDLGNLMQQVMRTLKGENEAYRVEHRVRRPDGGWIWIESQGSVVARDSEGRAVRMLGINAHVSRRKRMEAALLASETRFRSLTELSSDWYWEQDTAFRFTFVSDGIHARAGLRPDDCRGRTWWDVAALRDGVASWDGLRALLEDRKPFVDFEMECRDASGGVRYWGVSGKPVFDDAGAYAGYRGVGRDITERRTAEMAVRDAHAFLDSVVENIPDIVFVKDAERLKFVRINKAAEEFFGYARDELIGRGDHDFFPADQADFFVSADRRAVASGRLVDIPDEYIQTRSRGLRRLSTKKITLRDAQGKPRFLLGISQDITERKQAEAAIRDMNHMLAPRATELTAANRELEAYAHTVSHDLRAPLRHINGYLKLFTQRLGGLPDAEAMRLFERVTGAAQRMNQLIDDLLSFSRMSRAELRKAEVPLDALIAELVEELKESAAPRRIEWRIGALPAVCADRALLRLAFLNLLSNAVKYTGTREAAVIEIGRAPDASSRVVVYVRDNGVGFEMKEAHRLFGVFQRLHTREFEGTGIGLATVKRILERHGGDVRAEAKRDRGATFFVSLPVCDPCEPNASCERRNELQAALARKPANDALTARSG